MAASPLLADHTVARQPPRACDASPLCRPAGPILRQLGLASDAGWLWLHIGPIGPMTTTIGVHPPPISRAGPRSRHGPTRAEHQGFEAFRLDVLCVDQRPPLAARAIILPSGLEVTSAGRPIRRVWQVYAVSRRAASGPLVEWRATDGDRGRAAWQFFDDRCSADDIHAAGRCLDLILGRSARPGRPTSYDLTAWRSHAEAAEAMHREFPGLSRKEIADSLGLPERSDRAYRALLRREQSHVHTDGHGPALVNGGYRNDHGATTTEHRSDPHA